MTTGIASSGRARRDQVNATRIGLVISMVVAVGFALTALLSNPKVVRLRWTPPAQRAQQRVHSAAAELARAWHPADRSRVLDRLRSADEQDELRQAIGVALRTPNNKLKKEMIECAGALAAHEVRNEIAAIAFPGGGGGESQIAAIGVAHQLRRWRSDEAAELMATGDRSVRCAVLDAIGRHGGELPDAVLLQCLTSDDAAERELALRAMPQKPSDGLLGELRRLAVQGLPLAAAQALRALARGDDAVAHAELALACLHGRPAEVRRAALEFLSAIDAQLAHREQIWQAAIDPTADEKLHLFALQCLERLGGIDQEALATNVGMMTPAERLLAARCLVRAGNQLAVEILLALVRQDDESPVVESSRRLLAWLTGASMGASPAEFREAFTRSGRRMRTRYLPDHGLALD